MRNRTCTGCNITKPLKEYHKSKRDAMGVRSRCKLCIKSQCAEIYKKDIDTRRLKNRESHYRVQYKLTIEQVESMKIHQNFRCSICEKHETEFKGIFRVDHNHETGKVRGLLCHNCNCGIGHLRDSIELLEKAKEYLRRNDETI